MPNETYTIRYDPAKFPRSVTDLTCPSGHVITESTERRILDHVVGELFVRAPMGSDLDKLRRKVSRYLHDSCEHHWHAHTKRSEHDYESHRQCLWCNHVEMGEFGDDDA